MMKRPHLLFDEEPVLGIPREVVGPHWLNEEPISCRSGAVIKVSGSRRAASCLVAASGMCTVLRTYASRSLQPCAHRMSFGPNSMQWRGNHLGKLFPTVGKRQLVGIPCRSQAHESHGRDIALASRLASTPSSRLRAPPSARGLCRADSKRDQVQTVHKSATKSSPAHGTVKPLVHQDATIAGAQVVKPVTRRTEEPQEPEVAVAPRLRRPTDQVGFAVARSYVPGKRAIPDGVGNRTVSIDKADERRGNGWRLGPKWTAWGKNKGEESVRSLRAMKERGALEVRGRRRSIRGGR